MVARLKSTLALPAAFALAAVLSGCLEAWALLAARRRHRAAG